MTEQSLHVLLIEDDPDHAELIQRRLAASTGGFIRLTWIDRLEAGLERLAAGGIDAVMLDLRLPGSEPDQTLSSVLGRMPGMPIVVLTTLDDPEIAARALQSGAQDFLVKPRITGDALVRSVRYAIERKRLESQLRESEVRYRILAEAIPLILWTATPDGTFDFFNQHLIAYGGLADSDRRQGLLPLLHPDDAPAAVEAWEAARHTGAPYETEYRLRQAADGQYRWHYARIVPIKAAGAVVRWIGTAVDIHDRKLAERALHEADRRKDAFLAMLAHELRNPLAPIRYATQVLELRDSQDPVCARYRAVIERQVAHMARLLDDLLDVSRINRGKITLRRERLDLRAVIGEAVESSQSAAEAQRHQIHQTLPPRPIWVDGDPIRLNQVLFNLLSNAIKYTEPGGRIEVTAALESRDGTRGGLAATVTVRDSGIGIEPEIMPYIFDLFTQADQSLDRSRGGLGIGLNLVRTLVELHGGRIEARSGGANQGSEFTVRLPALAADSSGMNPLDPVESPAATAPDSPEPLRILVADDSLDMVDTMASFLELSGHEVARAYGGEEALRVAGAFRPDVVLLDIGMPGLDGFEVARRMRMDPRLQAARLIAQTGYGAALNDRWFGPGAFDYHFTKPVDLTALRDLLRELAASRPGAQAGDGGRTGGTARRV